MSSNCPFTSATMTFVTISRKFVARAVEADGSTAKMVMLETFEVFSLSYDVHDAKFHLNLCYADGKMLSMAYQKLEYCDWKEEDTEESVKWDLHEATQEIINDIESAVPTKLQEP